MAVALPFGGLAATNTTAIAANLQYSVSASAQRSIQVQSLR